MVSKKVKSIKPSGVRAIFDMAGKDSVNLGLGELNFRPPKEVTDACKRALDADSHRYGPTMGIPELRTKIARKLSKHNKDIAFENILITASGTEAALVTFQTLFQEGDDILIPDPGFVVYSPECTLCGANAVPYYMDENLDIDIESVKEKITKKTKGIIINSPSNPCGSVLSEESFKAIGDLAEDYDFWIISDEVYENFIYDGKHHSFNEYIDRAVIMNSFSKCFAVAGWRMGYISAPKSLMNDLSKMQYHVLACPPGPFQYAISDAFECQDAFINEILPILDNRRKMIVKLLNEIDGFSCPMPKGAFYAFPSYDQNISSKGLAVSLAKKGVLCSPGSAFGERGEGHLRFSYAASDEDIQKGIEIVSKHISEL